MAKNPLSAVFAAQWDDAARARVSAIAGLEKTLSKLLKSAEQASPTFSLPVDAFVRYLAERMPAVDNLEQSLDEVRPAELYLTCACARGVEPAIAALEARYFPAVETALLRIRLAPAKIDEVKQILRRQLFVAEENTRPKIAEYSGRGELRAWLRVSALRIAYRMFRKEEGEVLIGDLRLLDLAEQTDPELGYMKQVYRAAFKEAFQEALSSLSERQRNLLRQRILDGLTLEQIASLYHTSHTTAARWFAKACGEVLSRTRKVFLQRTGMPRSECDSVLRLVRSQLDITLRQLSPTAAKKDR